MLNPASEATPWQGYEYLPVDDRPHTGFDGITQEQHLWHLFHVEVVLRALHKYQQGQRNHFVESQLSRIDSLPVDR